jgi:hypothetical protein
MENLDEKIKKFKELSEKARIPKKQSKLSIVITVFLIALLFVQVATVYAKYVG